MSLQVVKPKNCYYVKTIKENVIVGVITKSSTLEQLNNFLLSLKNLYGECYIE